MKIKIILFLLVSLALLPFLHYSFNPDAIGYLRIASYYEQGQFATAVNACWSPLLSWLLVPFYALRIPPLIAFHLLNILIGCLCLQRFCLLSDDFFGEISPFTRKGLQLAAAMQLMIMQFYMICPDLLALCLLLFLLYQYLAGTLFTRPFRTGLTGALLFLAKAYCFWFFIVFIVCCTFATLWGRGFTRGKDLNKPRSRPRSLLVLITVFSLLSGGWITILHHKYGVWEMSSAATYNFSILNPDGSYTHPFEKESKLGQLPYPEAYCLWEDVQQVYHYSLGNPLKVKSIGWWFFLAGVNLRRIGSWIHGAYFGFLLFLPLIGYILLKQRKIWAGLAGTAYRKLLLFSVLYAMGYLFIITERRYIWLLVFSSLVISYKCIDLVPAQKYSYLKKVLVLALTGYFVVSGILYIGKSLNAYKDVYLAARALGRSLPPGSHIATYDTEDLWNSVSLFDLHNYGGIASYAGWASLQKDLLKYRIDYLVITDPSALDKLPASITAALTLHAKVGNTRIYSFKTALSLEYEN